MTIQQSMIQISQVIIVQAERMVKMVELHLQVGRIADTVPNSMLIPSKP